MCGVYKKNKRLVPGTSPVVFPKPYNVSVAVVDGDGESAEADNLEIDRLLLGPAWAGCSATGPCSSESSVTSGFFGFALSSEIRKFSISSEVMAGINANIIAGS